MKHAAFDSSIAAHRNTTVPDGYVDAFIEPVSPRYCCCVVSPRFKKGSRTRCLNLRQNSGNGGGNLTCVAHKRMEAAANDWMNERAK